MKADLLLSSLLFILVFPNREALSPIVELILGKAAESSDGNEIYFLAEKQTTALGQSSGIDRADDVLPTVLAAERQASPSIESEGAIDLQHLNRMRHPSSFDGDELWINSTTRAPPPVACTPQTCQLPNCYCNVTQIPGGLSRTETPQIVMLTFDDSFNRLVSSGVFNIWSPSRTNPNGCPITGTYFVSHDWTDYVLVDELRRRGHEIASHSINHLNMANYTEEGWRVEIVGQINNLKSKTKLVHSVAGMRAPYLAMGGDEQFSMMQSNGLLYDSSIIAPYRRRLWPFTLDTPLPFICTTSRCPTRSFPGIWEVPLSVIEGPPGWGQCSMYDACVFPVGVEAMADVFYTNFLHHYKGNRAPLMLAAHAPFFAGQPKRVAGLVSFIERVRRLGDVWFVSVGQMLDWVRSPTPISQLQDFGPWKCGV